LLSYELDRLFRAARRAPNVDLSSERAEAGRILLTTSSHSGISSDDRAYLIQQVGTLTGLSPADSERRVDVALGSAKTAIQRSRRSGIIVAFFIATAVLLGAVAAWLPPVLADGTEMAFPCRIGWRDRIHFRERKRYVPDSEIVIDSYAVGNCQRRRFV
jgi:hypothetical protein